MSGDKKAKKRKLDSKSFDEAARKEAKQVGTEKTVSKKKEKTSGSDGPPAMAATASKPKKDKLDGATAAQSSSTKHSTRKGAEDSPIDDDSDDGSVVFLREKKTATKRRAHQQQVKAERQESSSGPFSRGGGDQPMETTSPSPSVSSSSFAAAVKQEIPELDEQELKKWRTVLGKAAQRDLLLLVTDFDHAPGPYQPVPDHPPLSLLERDGFTQYTEIYQDKENKRTRAKETKLEFSDPKWATAMPHGKFVEMLQSRDQARRRMERGEGDHLSVRDIEGLCVDVEIYSVPDSDKREALRGQSGLRVSSSWRPEEWQRGPRVVLGMYSGMWLRERHWQEMKRESSGVFKQGHQKYFMEVRPFPRANNRYTIDASIYGNLLRHINDPHYFDGTNKEKKCVEDTCPVEIFYVKSQGWWYAFLGTTEVPRPGQELAMSYGDDDYWEPMEAIEKVVESERERKGNLLAALVSYRDRADAVLAELREKAQARIAQKGDKKGGGKEKKKRREGTAKSDDSQQVAPAVPLAAASGSATTPHDLNQSESGAVGLSIGGSDERQESSPSGAEGQVYLVLSETTHEPDREGTNATEATSAFGQQEADFPPPVATTAAAQSDHSNEQREAENVKLLENENERLRLENRKMEARNNKWKEIVTKALPVFVEEKNSEIGQLQDEKDEAIAEARKWKDAATEAHSKAQQCENELVLLREKLEKSEKEKSELETKFALMCQQQEKAAEEAVALERAKATSLDQQLTALQSSFLDLQTENRILSETSSNLQIRNIVLEAFIKEQTSEKTLGTSDECQDAQPAALDDGRSSAEMPSQLGSPTPLPGESPPQPEPQPPDQQQLNQTPSPPPQNSQKRISVRKRPLFIDLTVDEEESNLEPAVGEKRPLDVSDEIIEIEPLIQKKIPKTTTTGGTSQHLPVPKYAITSAPFISRPPVGKFGKLAGIAVNDRTDRLFLTDAANHQVHVFSMSRGEYKMELFGGEGSNEGQFKSPCGIGVSSFGRVFVADSGNDRVQAFHGGDGSFEMVFCSEGDGQLKRPTGLAVHRGAKEVHVCDTGNNRICVFSEQGEFLRAYGVGYPEEPLGIAIDEKAHHALVVTNMSQSVHVFDALGAGDLIDVMTDLGCLYGQKSIAVGEGSLAVGDDVSRRVQIVKNGEMCASFDLQQVAGMAFGPQDELFVCCEILGMWQIKKINKN